MTHADRDSIDRADELERRRRAQQFVAVFEAVDWDFAGSADGWRYGGGRDLSRLVEDARRSKAREAEGFAGD
ncbi:DUF2191 domain-containing protein [Kribbella sp. NPDC050241]|uniref:DUF2191 domain-containing protein n=1 Tax=Kribbella sp. NPDC050241 TaxID=3364115 RepID=UPI003795B944